MAKITAVIVTRVQSDVKSVTVTMKLLVVSVKVMGK